MKSSSFTEFGNSLSFLLLRFAFFLLSLAIPEVSFCFALPSLTQFGDS
jgi:hypothetical protein